MRVSKRVGSKGISDSKQDHRQFPDFVITDSTSELHIGVRDPAPQPPGQRFRFQLLRILHLDMTPLDSVECTAPPNPEARREPWYRRQLQAQQRGPLRVVCAPNSALRTAPSPARRATPGPSHPSPTSAPPPASRFGLHPVVPYFDLTSTPPCLLCSLHLPAPTPPTSNRSACPSHRHLNRRLWLSRFLVSFLPSLPGLQPDLLSYLCLATFFSASLVLCFPLLACLKPQYRLQSLYTIPSLRPPSSPASYLLAFQAPRTATSFLTFLGDPGPPWSQKQRQTERH